MSQVVGIEALYRAFEPKAPSILFVSRSEDLAINLLGYAANAYRTIKNPPVALTKQTQSTLEFSNGAIIRSVAASRNAGRGFPVSHAYIDEAAFLLFAEDIYRAVSPTTSQGGTLTVLSSPDGTGNLFHEIFEGERGRVQDFTGSEVVNAWSRHDINWRECPFYTEGGHGPDFHDSPWYLQNRSKYTERDWQSEYEASFVGSGDNVFSPEDVKGSFAGWLGGPDAWTEDSFFSDPETGHFYVTAWDIGRRNDPTVGITLDMTWPDTVQLVAYQRLLKTPFAEQIAEIQARYGAYPGMHVVEANSQGDHVIEDLHRDGFYVEPFVTTNPSKRAAIGRLQLALQNGQLKQHITQLTRELHLYEFDDRKLVQDSIMACAIALYVGAHVPIEEEIVPQSRFQIESWGAGAYW